MSHVNRTFVRAHGQRVDPFGRFTAVASVVTAATLFTAAGAGHAPGKAVTPTDPTPSPKPAGAASGKPAEPDLVDQFHAILLEQAGTPPAGGAAAADDCFAVLSRAIAQFEAAAIAAVGAQDAKDAWFDGIWLPDDKEFSHPDLVRVTDLGKKVIQHTKDTECWATLDTLAATRHFTFPKPPADLSKPLFPNVRSIRHLARASRAMMFLASSRGDDASLIRHLRHGLALARVVDHHGSLIGRLVAESVEYHMLEELLFILSERQLPSATLNQIREVFSTQPALPPVQWHLRLVGLELRFNGTRFLTPEGTPRTDVPPEKLAALFDLDASDDAEMPLTDQFRERYSDPLPLSEQLSQITAALDAYGRASAIPSPSRTKSLSPDAIKGLITAERNPLAKPLIDTLLPLGLDMHDRHVAFRNGTLAVLTIEQFRAANGKHPTSPAEAKMPDAADPYSGLSFKYRLTDPAKEPGGRRYVVYSVGLDGKDDEGKVDPQCLHCDNALRPYGSGQDFIINRPRSFPAR